MVKTYDPKKVLVSLGSHMVTGYADGTFVNIAYNGEGIGTVVGADGEVSRYIDPDRTANVTITVKQTSPTVDFCQRMHDKDLVTGEGILPILIKDMRGGLIFSANDSWVVKPPDREYGKDIANREIVIACGATTTEGA